MRVLRYNVEHKDDMLAMGRCQVLQPLCQLKAETAVVGSQQGLPFGSIGMVTTGRELVVDGFPTSLHAIQTPHPHSQGPTSYEAILSDHLQHSTVFMRCCVPRSPRGLVSHQSSSGSMPLENEIDGSIVRTMRPAKAFCRMSCWASASTSCLIPIGVR